MDLSKFTDSTWCRAAADPQARRQVVEQLPEWLDKVRSSDLLAKAGRLKEYLTSGRCSTGDVILLVAALLYLISPLDAVPDFIPFAGWLDDISVAALVIGYLDRKAAIRYEQQFGD